MPLNKRLSRALNWVNPSQKIADIGCDHGYLAIACLEKGVQFAQLIDNKDGPLQIARQNIIDKFPNTCYEITKCSGLDQLNSQVDCICILGMGGLLICEILEKGLNKIKNGDYLILEPNNKEEVVRKFLTENNFEIVDEDIVIDNAKFYELILAKRSTSKQNYDELDLKYGPILRKTKSNEFVLKWSKVLEVKKNIYKSHPLLTNMLEEIKEIEEIL